MKSKKGWVGYAIVDPKNDNYCNDQFFLHKKTAQAVLKKMREDGWNGMKVIEVEIYPCLASLKSEPNK